MGERLARAGMVAGILILGALPAAPCDSAACLQQTRGGGGLPRKGRWQVDLTFRHTSVGDGREGTAPSADVRRPWVDFERQTVWSGFHRESRGRERFVQVDIARGLSSRWAVGLSVPLHTRRVYDVVHGSSGFSYEPEGLGDTLAVVRRALGEGWVAGFGLKLPSGRSDVLDPTGTFIIEPGIQPGTGSVDVVGTLQRSFALPAMVSLGAAASYQVNRGNSRGYAFGDDAIASATLARRVIGPITGSLQIKGWRKGRSAYLDQGVPSTGATLVYMTPGARARLGVRNAAYAFLSVPVYRNVNERQLTPHYSLILGASRTF